MNQIFRSPLLFLSFLLISFPVFTQDFHVSSPDGQTVVTVTVGDGISWKAEKYGREVLPQVNIDLLVDDIRLGTQARVRRHSMSEVSQETAVLVPTKNENLKNHYNELVIQFRSSIDLHVRVFDDGMAYRFLVRGRDKVKIQEEIMDISFPAGAESLFPLEESTYSHNERTYIPTMIDTLSANQFASLPAMFMIDDVKVLFSEADVFDYPQMFVRGGEGNVLTAMHPPVVAETVPASGSSGDRNVVIVREEAYIAETNGNLPWRFFLISRDETDFLNQDMVLRLSRGNQLENTDWIRPGKVAWDWYNANNIWNVDFEAGLNTQTYKYYIDFASRFGIEYVILDEGWTKSTLEILDFNPDIDVPELIRYGKEKNVGIILWCLWKPLDENMSEILDTYAGWGAKGIKVDFMQRGDQYMTKSYEDIARECADRQLLVDFHGAFKPGGLRSAYPNIISYEGVKGNENNKWSHEITPTHNTILPFIRMAVGPMDYTPGAMRNFHEAEHPINFDRPAAMGTRSHQVALYTLFESPLQMLCDAPTAYLADTITTEFISTIPTTWDETIPLAGKVGEYVAIARRKGNTWYVAAITNNEPRELTLDLGFLPEGDYILSTYSDGTNATHYAEDYRTAEISLNPAVPLTIKLAPGGGWSGKVMAAF